MPAETHLRRFIVSRPMVTPLYLTGRATRGFWAVDESNDQLVFLKDTWRSSSADVKKQWQETVLVLTVGLIVGFFLATALNREVQAIAGWLVRA